MPLTPKVSIWSDASILCACVKISTSGKPLPHFAEDPCVVVVGKSGGKHGIKNEVWARPKSQEHERLSHRQMAEFALDTQAYPTVPSYVNQHEVIGEVKRDKHGNVARPTISPQRTV